jgi:hypothetical protein
MNERIRELAEESYNEFYNVHIDLELFVELIVQECAGVELYWLSEQDRKAVVEKIKEHFGVK